MNCKEYAELKELKGVFSEFRSNTKIYRDRLNGKIDTLLAGQSNLTEIILQKPCKIHEIDLIIMWRTIRLLGIAVFLIVCTLIGVGYEIKLPLF